MDGMPQLPVLETVPTAQVCCAPLTSAPLSVQDAAELSMRPKALADPLARLRPVSLLLVSETGELCTCDITEPGQPGPLARGEKTHRDVVEGHRSAVVSFRQEQLQLELVAKCDAV
jgi:hypothetical protein